MVHLSTYSSFEYVAQLLSGTKLCREHLVERNGNIKILVGDRIGPLLDVLVYYVPSITKVSSLVPLLAQ